MAGVSFSFSDGATLTASQLNTNFGELVAGQSQLRTGNLASDAGIVSGQLADRYTVSVEAIPLIPYTSSASDIGSSSTTQYSYASGSSVDILKWRMVLKSGQEAYLCAADLYLARRDTGSDYVQFQLLKNGSVLGGGAVDLDTANNFYRLGNANPLTDPLIGLQNGDELVFRLLRSGGTPTIGGLTAYLTIKREVIN